MLQKKAYSKGLNMVYMACVGELQKFRVSDLWGLTSMSKVHVFILSIFVIFKLFEAFKIQQVIHQKKAY